MNLVARLGHVIVEVLKGEATLIEAVESNWWNDDYRKGKRIRGLPGRREAHYVALVAAHLRSRGSRRVILDDDYRGDPTAGRCDMRIELPGKAGRRWFWVEFKTMPFEDATDKLRWLHDDVAKLNAAASTPANLPQAVVAIGFDYPSDGRIDLVTRLRHFACIHRLDEWPYRLGQDGVDAFALPPRTQAESYTRCVVGYWARVSAKKSPARVPKGKWYLVKDVERWAAKRGMPR